MVLGLPSVRLAGFQELVRIGRRPLRVIRVVDGVNQVLLLKDHARMVLVVGVFALSATLASLPRDLSDVCHAIAGVQLGGLLVRADVEADAALWAPDRHLRGIANVRLILEAIVDAGAASATNVLSGRLVDAGAQLNGLPEVQRCPSDRGDLARRNQNAICGDIFVCEDLYDMILVGGAVLICL